MNDRTSDASPGPVFDPELLSRCISCGFCLPACPTYAETGDEASSPRGRINLMRALQDGDLQPDDPTLKEQASQCLGCRACEPVCPAGVEYGRLLEQWRDHQWRGRRLPLLARPLMTGAGLRATLRLLGRIRGTAKAVPQAPASEGSLMLGCFERVLFPSISRAAVRLLPGLSVPKDQGCCGALHAHNGDTTTGEQLARRMGQDLPGLIVATSGGCAAHLTSVLGEGRVRELSDHLSGSDPGERGHGELRVDGRRARVALQDSCHLRNGLGVWTAPRDLLTQVADYVELPSAGTCCGAAGTYSLLRPKESRRVLDAKIEEIESTGVDYVAAVNPGCLRQLRTGLRRARTKAVHLADLLVMARALVTHPAVQAVGFTGSTAGGRALFDLAAQRPDPIPFYGELGSLNPVVVTPGALAARGADLEGEYIGSVTRSQGQLCTKPGLLFLPEDHGLDEPLHRAISAAPSAPMRGPWIADAYGATLDDLAAHPAVRRIGAAPTDSHRTGQSAHIPAAALLTVTADDLSTHPDLLRECFGPASVIVTYTSTEYLLTALRTVPGSLTATVHGRDDTDGDLARLIWSTLRAGRLIRNDWPTGVAVTRVVRHGRAQGIGHPGSRSRRS
ncbi:aldehyde dehydrogenase family protein [Streptomyces sp. rh34]|uniref:aldehyde dehydrogenase family protein n=1 Tax=Streptomyces sp. rh34 TaxID=2034272 RepID=UPI000BF11AEC|nr:aldehyde dehydrogenase family protein [Streptomyces sp. rh34]